MLLDLYIKRIPLPWPPDWSGIKESALQTTWLLRVFLRKFFLCVLFFCVVVVFAALHGLLDLSSPTRD